METISGWANVHHGNNNLKQADLAKLIAKVLANTDDKLLVEQVANMVLPYDYCHLDNDDFCEIYDE